eukprot:13386_1
MMNCFISIGAVLLIFFQYSDSAKIHVATEQELKDRKSSLHDLGDTLVTKDGVPLHISVYSITDPLTETTKLLQKRLDDCLNDQIFDPHRIEESILFEAQPNKDQTYTLQHKLHQAHQQIHDLHLHIEEGSSGEYIRLLQTQNEALRRENERLKQRIKNDESKLAAQTTQVDRLDHCMILQLNSEKRMQSLHTIIIELRHKVHDLSPPTEHDDTGAKYTCSQTDCVRFIQQLRLQIKDVTKEFQKLQLSLDQCEARQKKHTPWPQDLDFMGPDQTPQEVHYLVQSVHDEADEDTHVLHQQILDLRLKLDQAKQQRRGDHTCSETDCAPFIQPLQMTIHRLRSQIDDGSSEADASTETDPDAYTDHDDLLIELQTLRIRLDQCESPQDKKPKQKNPSSLNFVVKPRTTEELDYMLQSIHDRPDLRTSWHGSSSSQPSETSDCGCSDAFVYIQKRKQFL